MLNPSPRSAAEPSSQRRRPVSAARRATQAASRQNRTSWRSIVPLQPVATRIGCSASTSTARNAARRSEVALHLSVQEHDRGDGGERLRQDQAPAIQAEDRRAASLQPQPDRRFVNRQESGRIEGGVEQVLPALEHPAHGGGLVLVAKAFLAKPCADQERADDHRNNRRDPGPLASRVRSGHRPEGAPAAALDQGMP